MTVKELMQELYFLPQDMKILVAVDEEGNGYHEARVAERSQATNLDGWNWEAHHPEDEIEDTDKVEEAFVLWP